MQAVAAAPPRSPTCVQWQSAWPSPAKPFFNDATSYPAGTHVFQLRLQAAVLAGDVQRISTRWHDSAPSPTHSVRCRPWVQTALRRPADRERPGLREAAAVAPLPLVGLPTLAVPASALPRGPPQPVLQPPCARHLARRLLHYKRVCSPLSSAAVHAREQHGRQSRSWPEGLLAELQGAPCWNWQCKGWSAARQVLCQR